jgi:hypothetical protein
LEKELKKHTEITHPDPSTFTWNFPKAKRHRPNTSATFVVRNIRKLIVCGFIFKRIPTRGLSIVRHAGKPLCVSLIVNGMNVFFTTSKNQ